LLGSFLERNEFSNVHGNNPEAFVFFAVVHVELFILGDENLMEKNILVLVINNSTTKRRKLNLPLFVVWLCVVTV
jgi:hypothetical protein